MFEICILMSNDVILINVPLAVEKEGRVRVFIRRGSRLFVFLVLHSDCAEVSLSYSWLDFLLVQNKSTSHLSLTGTVSLSSYFKYRTATNYYFHHRWIVLSIKCQEIVKNAWAQGDILKCLVFTRTTVKNPKKFSLLSCMTQKSFTSSNFRVFFDYDYLITRIWMNLLSID